MCEKMYFLLFLFSYKEKKTYYITDTILKHSQSFNELKLQPHSFIIECIDKTATMQESDFVALLEKDLNTFCGKYLNIHFNDK